VGRLAVIGKHSTLGPPRPAPPGAPPNPDGLVDHGTHVALYRHGLAGTVPPHRIDHAEHLRILGQLGCDRVLALSSVGSLRVDRPVGSFVAPHDFIALDHAPVSTGNEHQHVVPGFSDRWRHEVLAAWRRAAREPIVDGGVYWQANGPRFETAAEIRLIATFADLVGMTVASECVAANQLGLAYAAVCVVDNLANGIGGTTLTTDEYERGAAENTARLTAALGRVVPALAA
jgi:5'-methylthioadenosine phosphorylase